MGYILFCLCAWAVIAAVVVVMKNMRVYRDPLHHCLVFRTDGFDSKMFKEEWLSLLLRPLFWIIFKLIG